MGNTVDTIDSNKGLIAGAVAAYYTGNVSYLTTGASIDQQIRVSQQADVDAKIVNREEDFAARDVEIDRKNRLLKSIAIQNVYSGAGGVEAFSGSSGNIINVSRTEAAGGALRSRIGSQGRKSSAKRIASGIRQKTAINIGTSLIDQADRTRTRG